MRGILNVGSNDNGVSCMYEKDLCCKVEEWEIETLEHASWMYDSSTLQICKFIQDSSRKSHQAIVEFKRKLRFTNKMRNAETSFAIVEEADVNQCKSLREKGNAIYKQLNGAYPTFGPSIFRSKVMKTEDLYMKALKRSNAGEKPSCLKNLGALHSLAAKYEWEYYKTTLKTERSSSSSTTTAAAASSSFSAKWKIGKAVDCYMKALYHGMFDSEKPSAWICGIQESISKLSSWAYKELETHQADFEPVMTVLCNTTAKGEANFLLKRKTAANLHHTYAKSLMSKSINCIEEIEKVHKVEAFSTKKDRLRAMIAALNISQNDVIRAEALSRQAQGFLEALDDQDLMNKIMELQRQTQPLGIQLQAVLSRIQAEIMMEDAMNGSFESVWDAIDLFFYSLRLSEERLLENEAIILSHVATCNSVLLQCEEKAKRYYFQSTCLGLSLLSARPHILQSEWYLRASQAVQKNQQKVVRDESNARKEDLKESTERMKAQLKEIRDNEKLSAKDFLVFIHEKYPHPDLRKLATLGVPSLTAVSDLKNVLKKAIVVYHPDSNVNYSKDLQVVFEEITKILNTKYVNYK